MRRTITTVALLLLLAGTVMAQDPPKPPQAVEAGDLDVDWGGTVRVTWRLSESEVDEERKPIEGFEGYAVYRSMSADGPFELVSKVDRGLKRFDDKGLTDGQKYYYRVSSIMSGVESAPVAAPDAAVSEPNWFHEHRFPNLLAVWLFASLLLGWIWTAGRQVPAGAVIVFLAYSALYTVFLLKTEIDAWLAFVPLLLPLVAIGIPILKRSATIYVRPIPAIQAVEEAIGRATEMGKPILFVPGISTIEDVATLAALNILAPVAEKAAEYDSKLIVPNYDPIVYTVTQEVVKEAYLKAGRPDAYSDENVFYLSARQFAYAAAVNGLMVREKPATNFFLGMFFAESLLLAETGNMTGAIQIAGTDAVTQLPFFIVACDYTLIGEELYAAGAYMGSDPKLTGSLKGQDWVKAVVIVCMLVFSAAYLVLGAFQEPGEMNETFKNLPKTLFSSGGR